MEQEDSFDHIETVRAYTERVNDAQERLTSEQETDSLNAGASLVWLYEDKSWVDKIELPKHRGPGRPPVKGSEAQFAKWIAQSFGLSASYTKRLMRAARWMAKYGAPGTEKVSGERAVREFYKLEGKGWGPGEIKAVMEEAAAESDHGVITARESRAAVGKAMKSTLPEAKAAHRENQADRLHKQARSIIADMGKLGSQSAKQLNALRAQIDKILNSKKAMVEQTAA